MTVWKLSDPICCLNQKIVYSYDKAKNYKLEQSKFWCDASNSINIQPLYDSVEQKLKRPFHLGTSRINFCSYTFKNSTCKFGRFFISNMKAKTMKTVKRRTKNMAAILRTLKLENNIGFFRGWIYVLAFRLSFYIFLRAHFDGERKSWPDSRYTMQRNRDVYISCAWDIGWFVIAGCCKCTRQMRSFSNRVAKKNKTQTPNE